MRWGLHFELVTLAPKFASRSFLPLPPVPFLRRPGGTELEEGNWARGTGGGSERALPFEKVVWKGRHIGTNGGVMD